MKLSDFAKILMTPGILFTLASCGPDGDMASLTRNAPPAPDDPTITDDTNRRAPPTSILIADNNETETEVDNRPARIKINIGVMLPLTGDTAEVGNALLNAITLALFDARDRRLEIIPVDTRGTPEGATAAAQELISRNVDVVIGPLFSESIKAAHPIIKNANVKIIGFSNDHDVAGDGVYLLSFRPEEQVGRIIKYASKQQYKKFAALIPDTIYGGRVMSVLEPLVASQFNDLIALEVYPSDGTQLDDPVKKIANYDYRRKEFIDEMRFLRSLGRDDDMGQEFINEIRNMEALGNVEFDAILLPEGGSMLSSLAPLLSYYEIDLTKVKVLGTGLWHDPMLFNEPQLQGGWFAAPDNILANQFIDRYSKAFGRIPPRLVSLGYDAMALIANIVRNQRAPNFSDYVMTNPNGFSGLDGIFRFHHTGLVERGLAVYEVTSDAFVKIDDAPSSFVEDERPLYVEIPYGFKPKYDPIFGLEGPDPTLTIDTDLELLTQRNLELSINPASPPEENQ